MQIRIVKKPPAPLMDGWDVSAFCAGQTCDVEPRLGMYLVVAGYADSVDDDATAGLNSHGTDPRDPRNG